MSYKPANRSQAAQELNQPPTDMVHVLSKFEGELKKALPRHMCAKRMARILLTEIRLNPKLAQCNRASFLGCAIQCAQLGLEPGSGLGHVYLIPRWSKKLNSHECTMQVGYQGLIDLMERDGRITVSAAVVYAKDEFEYREGTNPRIHHIPYIGEDTSDVIASYAVAVYSDGRQKFRVVPRHEIDKARAMSEAGDRTGSPWDKFYSEMARKTAIRRLSKLVPKSIELARALEIDEKEEIAGSDYALLEDGVEDDAVVATDSSVVEHSDPSPSQ